MNRILRIVTALLLFLSASFRAFSDEPPVVLKVNAGCRIAYHNDGDRRFTYGNTLLKEMARVVLKEPWLVEIKVKTTLSLSVTRHGGVDSLLISSSVPRVTGDTIYRGFSVSRELIPGRTDLRLRWASKADTSSFTGQDIPGLDASILTGSGYKVPVGLFDPETDTLLIEYYECYFDSAGFSRFMERTALIHNYYASAALLDSVQGMTKTINLGDISSLPVNYCIIEEINQTLELIDSLHFERDLLATQPDRLELRKNYLDRYRIARSLTFNFIDAAGDNRSIPWKGSMDGVTHFYAGRILSFIERSQWMDNLQGTIYGRFLEKYPERIPFPDDPAIPQRMLTRMYPEAAPDTLLPYLIRSLCSAMYNRSVELADNNRFNEAFAMASFSRSLALANGLEIYALRGENLMQRYGEGILNAFTGIAAGCINTGRYTMADLYLAKAGAYAQHNRRWIRSDTAYRSEFARLFFLRNQRCDSLLARDQFREALDCFKKIEEQYPEKEVAVIKVQLEEKKEKARLGLYAESVRLTARALKAGDPDSALAYDDRASQLRKNTRVGAQLALEQDDLAGDLAVIRYNRLVGEATEALDRRLFTLALHRFEDAQDIALFHPVSAAPGFDSLFHRAARHYLIIQLGSSQKLIWANLFDSANAMLMHTGKSAASYGLNTDPEINAAMERYREKIRDQQCRNLSDTLAYRDIMADRARINRSYIQAIERYTACERLASSLPECMFEPARYRDSIDRYLPAARYQQSVAESNALIAAGNYPKAFSLLILTDSTYKADEISRYGLAEPVIHDLLNERGNPYLTVEAVRYHAHAGDPATAILFLKMLSGQGMEAGMAGDVQEQVGRLVAVRDKKKNPLADPKTLLGEYTEENPWFRAFRMTYLKVWKED